jgi:hypothetical protein
MAHISLVAALLFASSYVVFRLLSSVVESRRKTAKARELGCQEPPVETTRLPFGIDVIMAAFEADKTQLFLEWINDRVNAVGAQTCKLELGA